MKAVIYARVSGLKQIKEGHGLEAQQSRCMDYIKRNDHEHAQTFLDGGISGGNRDRKGAQDLLDYLKSNKEPHLVVFDDTSRIARDPVFYFTYMEQLMALNATPHCLNMKIEDTPESELSQGMQQVVGKYTIRAGSRQVRQKMEERIKDGYYVFGKPPLGFKRGADKIIEHDENAPHIKHVLEGISSGVIETQVQAIKYLRDQGISTSKSAFHELIRNPIYAGMIEYQPWGVSMREGKHEAIISMEVFNKIQKRMPKKRSAQVRYTNSLDEFYLRGIISCSECGQKMTSMTKKNRFGTVYKYYTCKTQANSAHPRCERYAKTMRIEKVHCEVDNLIRQIQPPQDFIEYAMLKFEQSRRLEIKNHSASVAKAKRRLAALEVESQNLVRRIAKSKSDRVAEVLEEELYKMDRDIAQLNEEVNKKPLTSQEQTTLVENFCNMLANLRQLYVEGDTETKRMLIEIVLGGIIEIHSDYRLTTPSNALQIEEKGQKNVENWTWWTWPDAITTLERLIMRAKTKPPLEGLLFCTPIIRSGFCVLILRAILFGEI